MEQAVNPHHIDWLLGLLVLATTLVLAARLYHPSRFRAFLFLPLHANREELEDGFRPVVGRGLFDVSLGLMSFCVLALSVFLLLNTSGSGFPMLGNWRMYLRLLMVLLFFYVGKNFLGLLVGWVFNTSEEIARAQNVSFAYRAWLTLFLLPVAIAMVYCTPLYNVLYYILLITLLVGYLFSLQFFILRIWRINALSYYKIFYLCALEITPLIFLVIWLKSL